MQKKILRSFFSKEGIDTNFFMNEYDTRKSCDPKGYCKRFCSWSLVRKILQSLQSNFAKDDIAIKFLQTYFVREKFASKFLRRNFGNDFLIEFFFRKKILRSSLLKMSFAKDDIAIEKTAIKILAHEFCKGRYCIPMFC